MISIMAPLDRANEPAIGAYEHVSPSRPALRPADHGACAGGDRGRGTFSRPGHWRHYHGVHADQRPDVPAVAGPRSGLARRAAEHIPGRATHERVRVEVLRTLPGPQPRVLRA